MGADMLSSHSSLGCSKPPAVGADMIVADRPIAGIGWSDYCSVMASLIERAAHGRFGGATASLSAGGVREYLGGGEGEGFWDHFRFSEHLSLSIVEATYRSDHWIAVEGGRFFKVRILLAGRLLDRTGHPIIEGPRGYLHVCPGDSGGGYRLEGGTPTTLVVVHCAPQLLDGRLGLSLANTPVPLRSLLERNGGPSVGRSIGLTPELYRAARWIQSSRYSVLPVVRGSYLEALAMQIICQFVTDLAADEAAGTSVQSLPLHDRRRILAARDYLSRNYAAPPTIPQLAREVGMSQTTLKVGFRQLFSSTIYDYILERRMDAAAQLLAARDLSVAEIAYRVGYDFPANFSSAFKRYYGRRPREWQRGARQPPGQ